MRGRNRRAPGNFPASRLGDTAGNSTRDPAFNKVNGEDQHLKSSSNLCMPWKHTPNCAHLKQKTITIKDIFKVFLINYNWFHIDTSWNYFSLFWPWKPLLLDGLMSLKISSQARKHYRALSLIPASLWLTDKMFTSVIHPVILSESVRDFSFGIISPVFINEF